MAGWGAPPSYGGPIGAAYARDPRLLYAQALRQGGTSTAPVDHWTQGLARLAQAGAGAFLANKVKGEYDERNKNYSTALAEALKGNNPLEALTTAAASNPDIAQQFGGTILQGRMGQQEKAADRDFTINRDKAKMEYDSAQGELQRAHAFALQDRSTAAQQALQAASQRFQAAENGLQRAFSAGQQTSQQQFTAGQTDKQIAAQAAAAQAARDAQAAARADERDAPLQMVPDPAGSGQMVPRATAQAYATSQGNLPAQMQLKATETGAKPLTEDQAKAAGFYDRMINAEGILADPKAIEAGSSRFNRAVTGDTTGFGLPFGKEMAGEDYGRYEQAKRSFINAVLRKESGAVIGKEEFESADKQYFPQPGDSATVKEQKARERQIAVEAMKRAAGTGFRPAPAASAGTPTAAANVPKLPDGFVLVP